MMDTKTAARKFGLSKRQVSQLCQSGLVEAEKIGGAWILQGTDEEIEKQIEARPRAGWVLKEKTKN